MKEKEVISRICNCQLTGPWTGSGLVQSATSILHLLLWTQMSARWLSVCTGSAAKSERKMVMQRSRGWGRKKAGAWERSMGLLPKNQTRTRANPWRHRPLIRSGRDKWGLSHWTFEIWLFLQHHSSKDFLSSCGPHPSLWALPVRKYSRWVCHALSPPGRPIFSWVFLFIFFIIYHLELPRWH